MRKIILWILFIALCIWLCLWIRIALFVNETYQAVKPFLIIRQKGLSDNFDLHYLVMDSLKTRRYSQLNRHLTSRGQREFNRFVQDWELRLQSLGDLLACEHFQISFRHRTDRGRSFVVAKCRYRFRMKRGVTIVECEQIYENGVWKINSINLKEQDKQ